MFPSQRERATELRLDSPSDSERFFFFLPAGITIFAQINNAGLGKRMQTTWEKRDETPGGETGDANKVICIEEQVFHQERATSAPLLQG